MHSFPYTTKLYISSFLTFRSVEDYHCHIASAMPFAKDSLEPNRGDNYTSSFPSKPSFIQPVSTYRHYVDVLRIQSGRRFRTPSCLSRQTSFPKAPVSVIRPEILRRSPIVNPKSVTSIALRQSSKYVHNSAKARQIHLPTSSGGRGATPRTQDPTVSKRQPRQVQWAILDDIKPSLEVSRARELRAFKEFPNANRPSHTLDTIMIDLSSDDEGVILRKDARGIKNPARIKSAAISPREMGYPYRPLKTGEFRLLAVAGKGPKLEGYNSNNGTLICRFIHATLIASPPFEALSYTWGSPAIKDRLVRIYEGDKLHWLLITQNLEQALLHLRQDDDQERVMWIDAVCINQEDLTERSAQVMRMAEIYSKAFNVCVWLGFRNSSEGCISRSAVLKLHNLKELDRLTKPDLQCKQGAPIVKLRRYFEALGALFRRAWFTRRWVLQEIALARKATVHWDSYTLDWEQFAVAATLYENKSDDIALLLQSGDSTRIKLGTAGLPDPHAVSANDLVVMKSNVFQRSKNDNIERLQTLQTLVLTLPSFAVSEPKDVIYSVLSLAKDTYNTRHIVPDYSPTKSTIELYVEFMSHAIKQSRSLDIICIPWADISRDENGESLTSLPSWIAGLSGRAKQQDRESGYYSRINADSLIGRPERPKYSATKGSKIGEDFKILRNPYRMIVRGRRVAAIDQLGEIAKNGVLPMGWLKMAIESEREQDSLPSWAPPQSSAQIKERSDLPYIPEAFWRTLVADRDDKGDLPPPWYHRSCQDCFNQQPPSAKGRNIEKYGVDTWRLIDNFTSRTQRDKTSSPQVKFLQRVQETTWNRKFFITAKGTFGMAPVNAKERDMVYLLLGCSVPVVLRKVDKVDSHYRLIGECYVQGIMGGELSDRWGNDWGKPAEMLVELR